MLTFAERVTLPASSAVSTSSSEITATEADTPTYPPPAVTESARSPYVLRLSPSSLARPSVMLLASSVCASGDVDADVAVTVTSPPALSVAPASTFASTSE